MKVSLAGYNIDESLIKQIKNKNHVTPETISAAYARISRSKKTVTELREESLKEVEKARNSNENIIYEMGHSSIAEHAVFNFDILGVSRYMVEFIEKTRLASFTEKSQRYVTLKGDYVIPAEIKGSELELEFQELIEVQNELYRKLYKKAVKYLEETGFDGSNKELQGKAKEDARYVLALATETQLGMTINARSLTRLLRRLDSVDLQEASDLKELINKQVMDIAPSLIRYTESDEFELKLQENLPEIYKLSFSDGVELLGVSENPEDSILTSLLFEKYGYDIVLLMNYVKSIDQEEKKKIFKNIFSDMECYHAVPRAFEVTHFTFQITMSSCCFGQMKRHRMSTILRSDYNPKRGYIIPPLIDKLGCSDEIESVMEEVKKFYNKLNNVKPRLGNYILTNAHKVSVLFQANLRELYHFSRLRSDSHAQWEIKEIAWEIDKLLKKEIPIASHYIGGKDQFLEMKK